MRTLLLALILIGFSSVGASAQSSPALDPDWIELQPKETFFGVWGNQFAGSMIRTVKPFTKEVPEGVVFISGIDTLGLGPSVSFEDPVGARVQNTFFSLFGKKSILTLSALWYPEMIPLPNGNSKMIARRSATGALLLFEQNADRLFDYQHVVYLATHDKDGLFGENSEYYVRDLNGDGLGDIIAVNNSGETHTSISVWDNIDLLFRGDTTSWGDPVVPATLTHIIPHCFQAPFKPNTLCVSDFDQDGVLDLVFASGLTFISPRRYVEIAMGKIENDAWSVGEFKSIESPGPISYAKSMDFLLSDNKQDLLTTVNDTIFCFASKPGFLRDGLNFDQAELKIASPAHIDPKGFKGNGRGAFYEFGEGLFDAGNINGSGEHSLGTYGLYAPDTNSAFGITYFLYYSGGKAADERIDAVFGDNARYAMKENMDTLHLSSDGLTDLLVADPSNTMGATGRIDFVKGTKSIPHKPDSRWSSVVVERTTQRELRVGVVGVDRRRCEVEITGLTTTPIELAVYDVLGRMISQTEVQLYNTGSLNKVIDLSPEPTGAYIIVARQNSLLTRTKVFID